MTVVAGRYRLLERIGQGGMGVVWRAHDELLRRDIAVKELHVRVGVDGDYRSRQVLREARAAARLRHPGVVAVHDVIVDNGRPLIVMELVEGLSLAELIRKEGPLPEQRVAVIGARVLAALSAAHAHGVVHRDVKPANILLDGDRVILTDFGIAAMTSDTTITDAMVGSPEYLAPERVNGDEATPATDLWSLGVALCAALRGESPFQRSDTQGTLAAVLTHEPEPIPQAPRLWPVLASLLHKDPRQRPTATEAGTLLTSVAGLPAEHFESPPRRSMRLVALAAALVIVVAAGVWLVTRKTDTGQTRATPTVSAPAGFTGHRGDGFTLAVPTGWFKDSSDQEIYWVNDPHDASNMTVSIEWYDEANLGGAHGELDALETEEFAKDIFTNYQRLRFDTTAAPSGMTAAELEVTYHYSADDDFDAHELIRVVVTDAGQTYMLSIVTQSETLAAAALLWQDEQDTVATILDSFVVTP